MDVDESIKSITDKVAATRSLPIDPSELVIDIIKRDIPSFNWSREKSVGVPTWLQPIPLNSDLKHITVENFVRFIDQDGCRDYMEKVYDSVYKDILPDIPCLLGVDHSLSGGAIKACSDLYGKEHLSVVILDSHLDAIPVPAMVDAIKYDIDTNSDTLFDSEDPFLNARVDSYNAASFLYHLLIGGQEVIKAENVYVIGISDYPPEDMMNLPDPRIKNYLNRYVSFRQSGAHILTKDELQRNPAQLLKMVQGINTPYVYISIDLDIGAGNALQGVRFLNRYGLSEDEIYYVAAMLRKVLMTRNLAGLDLMEFNPRQALFSGDIDSTYAIAANLIKIIAFGVIDHILTPRDGGEINDK